MRVLILLLAIGTTACTTDDTTTSPSGPHDNPTPDPGGQGASCVKQTDCMTDYTCIEIQPNDPRICAQDCTGNIDCDLGFHCCGLVNVPKNVCVPTNYDNGNCMQ